MVRDLSDRADGNVGDEQLQLSLATGAAQNPGYNLCLKHKAVRGLSRTAGVRRSS